MAKFHETLLGRRFYEAHIPRIMDALESIAKSLAGKKSETIEEARERHAKGPCEQDGCVLCAILDEAPSKMECRECGSRYVGPKVPP